VENATFAEQKATLGPFLIEEQLLGDSRELSTDPVSVEARFAFKREQNLLYRQMVDKIAQCPFRF